MGGGGEYGTRLLALMRLNKFEIFVSERELMAWDQTRKEHQNRYARSQRADIGGGGTPDGPRRLRRRRMVIIEMYF